MIFSNPVRGTIGLLASDPDPWFRSQEFGCTGFAAEPPLGNCKHYHRGIDIARGPDGCGDDVLAMAPGTVAYAGTLNGGSKAVVIRHAGGIATGASHLSAISVKEGQKVKTGAVIGKMGQTGNATGCHDHCAAKTGFPNVTGNAAANAFYLDVVGKWIDPWPQLAQNVRVHPKALDSIRIRTQPRLTTDTIYAETDNGQIVRTDGTDLGSSSEWRKWGGTVAGADYGPSNKWERMTLDAHALFVASEFAVLSAK